MTTLLPALFASAGTLLAATAYSQITSVAGTVADRPAALEPGEDLPGGQATTLVIRAMALGEVRLKDWWRIVRRELACGFALGAILATIGLLRILFWQAAFGTYG